MRPQGPHGSHLLRRDLAGWSVVESAHAPLERVGHHRHGQVHVCVVLTGEYQQVNRSAERHCAGGTVLVHTAGEEHHNRMGRRPVRCLNLYPGTAWGGAGALADGATGVDRWAPSAGLRLFVALRDGAPDPDLHDAATELLASLVKTPTAPLRCSPPAWIGRIADRLADQGDVAPIATVAREEGVHPVYLARAFRRWLGVSPSTWRRGWRVRAASHAVAWECDSLGTIAARFGFTDQAHLSHEVRRHLGRPPGHLRRELHHA